MRRLFGKGRVRSNSHPRELLTPEELHQRAEELWAALYVNHSRSAAEGKQALPDSELLYRLMNLVDIILSNNKHGRKGFDCGDPQWSRESEWEVFKSVRFGLEKYLNWQLDMPMTEEEREWEEYKKALAAEMIGDSRKRYGKYLTEEDIDPQALTPDDLEWLRRFKLRPE